MSNLRFTNDHWQLTIADATAVRQYHIHDLGENGYLVLDNIGCQISIEDSLVLAQIAAENHFKNRG